MTIGAIGLLSSRPCCWRLQRAVAAASSAAARSTRPRSPRRRPEARRHGAGGRRQGRQGRRRRAGPRRGAGRRSGSPSTPSSATRPRPRSRSRPLLGAEVPRAGPAGAGPAEPRHDDPDSRTASPYDVIEAFSDLPTTTERDRHHAAGEVASRCCRQTFTDTPPRCKASLEGLARLSQTISSRDPSSASCSPHPRTSPGCWPTATASSQADHRRRPLLAEVQKRRPLIHTMLTNTQALATQLTGLVADNRARSTPALQQLTASLAILRTQPGRPGRRRSRPWRRSSGCSPTPSATAAGSTATSPNLRPRVGGAASAARDARRPRLPARLHDCAALMRRPAARRRWSCGVAGPAGRARLWPSTGRPAPVTAYFTRAVGLYRAPTSGSSASRSARSTRCPAAGRPGRVDADARRDVKVPADAQAVDPRAVAGQRPVRAAAPAYTGGADDGRRRRHPAGAHRRPGRARPGLPAPRRPEHRPRAERAPTRTARCPDLLDTGAANLDGNGEQAERDRAPALARRSAPWRTAATTCSPRWTTCRPSPPRWPPTTRRCGQFNTDLAAVADQLAGEREDLGAGAEEPRRRAGRRVHVRRATTARCSRPTSKDLADVTGTIAADQQRARRGAGQRAPSRCRTCRTPTTRRPAPSTPATTPTSSSHPDELLCRPGQPAGQQGHRAASSALGPLLSAADPVRPAPLAGILGEPDRDDGPTGSRRLRRGRRVAVGSPAAAGRWLASAAARARTTSRCPAGSPAAATSTGSPSQFADVLDLVPQSAVKVGDVTVGRSRRSRWTAGRRGSPCGSRTTCSCRPTRPPSSSRPACSARSTSRWRRRPTRAPVGRLADGDVIPLARTGRNPEVEEVLGAMSLLLNGGGVAQLKTIETELNQALTGNEPAVRDLLTSSTPSSARWTRRRPRSTGRSTSVDRLAGPPGRAARRHRHRAGPAARRPEGARRPAQAAHHAADLAGPARRRRLAGHQGRRKDDTVADLSALKPVLKPAERRRATTCRSRCSCC